VDEDATHRPDVISIGNVVSVSAGVRYFEEAVAENRVDYYAGRGEAPGVWLGPCVERLGLHGTVERADLVRVLEGRHPVTGEELGRRHAKSKNVAFDVTFSVPKGVSLLYALGDHTVRDHVLAALAAGSGTAHAYLLRHAGWGRVKNPQTGRIERIRAEPVTAAFVHRTARPVTHPDGRTTVDPQLHTHLLIASFAYRVDGTWGQLDSGPLYAHAAAASAVGQAAVRDALVRTLGVRVRTNPNGTFEVEGFTREQLVAFSQRHAQVVAAASAIGATSMQGVKVAVLDSRQSKHEVELGLDIFGHWRARADAVGLDGVHVRALLDQEQVRELRWFDVNTVSELLGRDGGLTAQSSVFTRRDLVRALAAHAPLGMDLDRIEKLAGAILSDPTATVPMTPPMEPGEQLADALQRWAERGLEIRYSTPEIVASERRALDGALSRLGEKTAVVDRAVVAGAISRAPSTLTPGQRSMVEAICTSPAGVVVVEGAAGVGKTFAMRLVHEVFSARGIQVGGCAASGRAVRGLETDAGIPSLTVTSLLHRLNRGDRLRAGSVVVVDECSMLGFDLAELVLLAERDRTKLVLIGDSQQLQPIEGGGLFRSLGDALGRVEVSDVVRQREAWEREAITALRRGDAAPLIRRYLDAGRIRESVSEPDRLAAIAGDWVQATGDGRDCIVIARERATVASLNAVVRTAAVDAGLVLPDGVHRSCVEDVGRKQLGIGELEFAVGDRLLVVGRNDRRLWLLKGMRGTIVRVEGDGALVVRSADDPTQLFSVPVAYRGITHGYAMTAHRAQGATADVALVHGSDAADRQWLYVAMSRHREHCRYYDVVHPERDEHGVHHGPPPQPARPEERLERAARRDGTKFSSLDYPDAYRAPQREPIRYGARADEMRTKQLERARSAAKRRQRESARTRRQEIDNGRHIG
jgi:conjugative relaxase-like TrwC/TraI family protein